MLLLGQNFLCLASRKEQVMRFKKRLFIFEDDSNIAITYAHSKEEAMHIFEKQFPDLVGNMIKEAEFDFMGIAAIKK